MGNRGVAKRLVSLLFLLFLCTTTNSKDSSSQPRFENIFISKREKSSETKDEKAAGIELRNNDSYSVIYNLSNYSDISVNKGSVVSPLKSNYVYKNLNFNSYPDLLRESDVRDNFVIDSDILRNLEESSKFSQLRENVVSETLRYPTLSTIIIRDNGAEEKSSYEASFLTDVPKEKHRSKRRVSENLLDKDDSSSTFNSRMKNPLEKGRKQSGGNPDIDDIIHGIMKLLGGNVKLTASESKDTRLTTFGSNPSTHVLSTRINNRGPPRLPILPFGLLPHAPGLTRPPIRPPITPPSVIGLNRPQFVANTRPPFLVPLPPALSARPTMSKPYLTGIPIPEDVLSGISFASPKTTVEMDTVTPSFTDATEEVEVNTKDLPEEEEEEWSLSNQEETSHDSIPHASSSSSVTEVSSSFSSIDSVITSTTSSSSIEVESTSIKSTPSTVKSINLIATKKTTTPQSIKVTPTISSPSEYSHLNHLHPTPTKKPSSVVKELSDLTTSSRSVSSSSPSLQSSISSVTSFSSSTTSTSLFSFPSFSRLPEITSVDSSSSKLPFPSFPTRLPGPLRPYITTGHPGLVLEDTVSSTMPTLSGYQGQLITANPIRPFNLQPDVFDVTVSALQGYGSPPNRPNRYPVAPPATLAPLITSPKRPEDGSVFIDGRKTYFDLLPQPTIAVNPVHTVAKGVVIPEAVPRLPPNYVTSRPTYSRPIPPSVPRPEPPRITTPATTRRPATLGPPKRIDTCIVGYDTTCKEELGEVCRTEGDVSSCFCRPGTARRRARTKCKKSVLLHLSLKVDRIGERRIVWGGNYANPEAKEYQLLYYEAEKALDSALGQSRGISSLYMESSVNKFYSLGGRVIVNSTIKLLHTPQTASPSIRKSLQRHLIRVIQTNNNYVGSSVLAVEGPLNPIPDVSDVNECFDSSLYDCHDHAVCSNVFGSYDCLCEKGFTDRYPDDPNRSGRFCDSCSRDFCTKRGECRIEDGQNVCLCEDSFYGARCEIDGEVVAVAVGASVAAVVIIILTLIFLCMWSQRWKAQDRKTEILSRIPGGLFGGLRGRGVGRDAFSVDIHQKGGPAGTYGVSMEDRIRWAQMAETLAQQNVYAPSASAKTVDPCSTLGISVLQDLKKLQETGKAKGGFVTDVLRLFVRRGRKSTGAFPHVTPAEALTLHHMFTLQAQMNMENPDQIRSTPFYHEQRKVHPPPSDYASVGTLTGFPQQFGMQHLSPPFMPHTYASKGHPSYGQFGPSSTNTQSVGGISRAPTMGARTPSLPVRGFLGGSTSAGPFGGGVVSKDGGGALLTESSEEDPERPYQLPRPKSRSSALDNDDFYFDPDDMTSQQSRLPPPLPSSPPPPLPGSYQFDQFFKSRFP